MASGELIVPRAFERLLSRPALPRWPALRARTCERAQKRKGTRFPMNAWLTDLDPTALPEMPVPRSVFAPAPRLYIGTEDCGGPAPTPSCFAGFALGWRLHERSGKLW